MYKLTLIKNINAQNNYFNKWLRDNYSPNFKGTSEGGAMYVYFDSEPDEEHKTEIENYYNSISQNDWLDSYKLSKIDEINFKTEELIKLGYYYSGKVFSLSTNAQTNILALYTSRNDSQIIYPIEYNTLNDLESFMIQDSSDIESLYLTALGTKKAHLDSGTILKNLVRDAINQEEVNSIIDNR